MSLSKAFIDGFLVEWDAGEYTADVRMLSQRSRKLAAEFGGSRESSNTSTASRAEAVRDRLSRTVRRAPEVMVKITSACRGLRQIGKHLDYISRKGELELEDQDGLALQGREQLRDLKSEWRINGPEEIATTTERRDTLNVVFSMPAHTDEVSMKRAVRAFAALEFDGHSYVFAYHTQATDPDPSPPAHPHVHLSVKTQGYSGRRLNPRKADLQRWREGFAAQLRAHGIEANATSRLARLNREKGPSRSKIAVERRDSPAPFRRDGSRASTNAKGERLEDVRRGYYGALVEVLSRSEIAGDRALADELLVRFGPGGRKRLRHVDPER